MSILQGAGSGNITLGRSHFDKLTQLIGIEIQGYEDAETEFSQRSSSLRLAADALLSLQKLTYLSLDNVLLHQRFVETPQEEFTSKIVTIRKFFPKLDNGTDVLTNLESQLIFLSPKEPTKYDPIVPYSVYKSDLSGLPAKNTIDSNGKPPEPKVAVAFTDIPSLLHLRISGCNMQDLSWDMFHRLQGLKFLLLERNDLLFLPDFVFYATSNLTSLSLSRNRILSLQTVGLAGLLYLQKLDVTHNNITHLSELSLPPFPHLEVADFRHNPIETIYPNTFEVMNTTKSLYLGSPLISLQISPNSFFGLTSLLKLEITNIRVDFLERPMLKGPVNLKLLVIDGKIKEISYDAFSEVPKIERLVLRKCEIERVSMDAFIGLGTLIELDLSHNLISFLPPGIFDDQTSLREIYLQHNKLTTLSMNLFARTPSKMVRLERNPWHCSCDMVTWDSSKINQVKSYFIPKNNTFCQRKYDKGSMCQTAQKGFQVKYTYEKGVSPLCETPKKFNQRSVFDIFRKELRYCRNSLFYNKSMLKATEGFKVTGKFTGETFNILKSDKAKKSSTQELKTSDHILKQEVSENATGIPKMEGRLTSFISATGNLKQLKPVIEESSNLIAHNRIERTDQLARTKLFIGNNGNLINPIGHNTVPLSQEFLPPGNMRPLKSLQSMIGTSPPLKKSMTKNILLSRTNPKLISKKALKLARLYAAQKRERINGKSN